MMVPKTEVNWRIERIEHLVREQQSVREDLSKETNPSDRQQLQNILTAQSDEIHKLRKDLGWIELNVEW